ncbi:MAG: hypothetical protein Q4G70_01360 [Pseudomonadota bacterium]|nr:hypothetical protein [Pseudomonadota bacterium]
MTTKLSTGLASELANSKSASLGGGFIDIYAGPVPPSADASIGSATLLCRLTLNGDNSTGLDLSTEGRFLRKPPGAVWSGTGVAAGVATFYRHVKPGDDGTASTTAIREQGVIGLTPPADMVLMSVTFDVGTPFPLDRYLMEQPLE